jgi:hypothetical protein
MKWNMSRRIVVGAIGIFVCAGGMKVSAETIYRFHPGVRISQVRPLQDKQRSKFVSGLRVWTGLTELEFDANGDLVLGDRTKFSAGSATARALIIDAVDSRDSFVVERFDKSPLIAFAQIEDTDRYFDGSGDKHIVWQLRIDFSDFKEVAGDDDALSAFDPVASFVHELSHAVKGYVDSVGRDDRLGECETYVNLMRAELGLPKRVYYFPQQRRATKPDGLTFVQGELSFVREPNSGGTKEVFINFNIEKIVDLSKAKSRAEVETNLLALRRGIGR